MINFCDIIEIYEEHLGAGSASCSSSVAKLVLANLVTNQQIWELEDAARADHLGHKHIADAKRQIDVANQNRNNQIREIDQEIHEFLSVKILSSPDAFFSESPGMIIDRLAILHLKLRAMSLIVDKLSKGTLSDEYVEKVEYAKIYIDRLGRFFDRFMIRLKGRTAYFEIQRPLKIYNDLRVRRYIRL